MLLVRMFSSDKTNRKHARERNETKYDVSIEENILLNREPIKNGRTPRRTNRARSSGMGYPVVMYACDVIQLPRS